jgi:exosortase H (IPTLxxWG-CTERM-specific)
LSTWISSPRGQVLRFVGFFVALVVGYALLAETAWVMRWIHVPLSRALAAIVATLLTPFGEVTLAGEHLRFGSFQAQIVEACNGLLPTYLYSAAVLAFPSRWRDRGWGILLGIPTIFVINIARIFSLMLLGAHRPDLVEKVHIDIWQTAVVILAMALWLYWAERTRRRQPLPA